VRSSIALSGFDSPRRSADHVAARVVSDRVLSVGVRVVGVLTASLVTLGAWSSPALSETAGPTVVGSAGESPAGTLSNVAPVVRVSGNRLVDGSGAPLQLRGVNRSGLEYSCIQGSGFFDGPSDDASIAAMASWATDVVRLPLNEDCWLGINGNTKNAPYMGAVYRSTVQDYVKRLHARGLAVILDLQTGEPGTTPSGLKLEPMPDADHAGAFWSSVGRAFSGDHSAVFDLYNEPHDVTWSCWRDGCLMPSGWRAAGMQSLLNAVRSTGATNTVIVGGLGYSNDMSGWLANRPADPAGQLAVSFHLYNFTACGAVACWDAEVAPVAASVPVVTGELGENDCASGFVNPYMDWADAHRVSYLGWTWDTWDCSSGPSLISNYDGTPTAFGQGIRDHYLAEAAKSKDGAAVLPRASFFKYPADGSVAVSSLRLVTWTPVPSARGYYLVVGTTAGGYDLENSGVLGAGVTSYPLPDLPTGVDLHARLYSETAGSFAASSDITFRAAPGHATLTYPADGQADVDTERAFSWTPVADAQGYYLTVGTAPGRYDLANSGVLTGEVTSYSVPALPTATTLYARVYTEMDGAFTRYQDVKFTAVRGQAELTSPTAGGSAVTDPVSFAWTTVGAAVGYDLTVGTAPGGYDVVNSGSLPSTTTTYTAGAMPKHRRLYARIYTELNGSHVRQTNVTFTM
jgi:endoglucanase